MFYFLLLLVYTVLHLVKQPVRRLSLSLPAAGLLALLLCLANDVADHFFAPIGIMLTPLVLVTAAALLNTPRKAGYTLALPGITAILCCLHDAGIKLYGGGQHDLEGQGFMNAFFFAGLLPSYILVLVLLVRSTEISRNKRIAAAFIMPLIVICYLYFFGALGVGRYYGGYIVD